MQVAMTIAGGLIMFGIFLLFGKLWGNGNASLVLAAKAFLPVWLVMSTVNLGVGVYYAGYELREELPIFLLVFIVPATAAGWALWQFSR
jgi:hypothetical protein